MKQTDRLVLIVGTMSAASVYVDANKIAPDRWRIVSHPSGMLGYDKHAVRVVCVFGYNDPTVAHPKTVDTARHRGYEVTKDPALAPKPPHPDDRRDDRRRFY